MANRVGEQLGNYRLTRPLGRGGFADVYLGEHIFLRSLAAIKILHAQMTEEDLQHFLQEAQIIASMRHPNIVRILEFGIDTVHNLPFFVMDYAPLGTLRQRHPSGSIVPLVTVLSYVKPLVSALQYAHTTKRIVHCDIKPENMLLGENGELLLSDFGVSVVARNTTSLQTMNSSGTVYYMPPEQIDGKPRPASDQYALAVVIYEWLTGNLPFTGSLTEIILSQISKAPPPLRSWVPAIPQEVERVVLRALAKDPGQRFASISAFEKALEQASQGVTSPHGPGTRLFKFGGHSAEVSAVAWSPDGRRIASGGTDNSVQVWDSITGARMLKYMHTNWVRAVAWSPDGSRLASASYDNSIQIWDYFNGQLLFTCLGHTHGINSLVWSPDGTRLASSSWDKTVRIWDAMTGKAISAYGGHTEVVSAVAWSPDNELLASAGSDKTVHVRHMSSGRLLQTYRGHRDCVNGLAWAPDGRTLASASDDEHVHLWDALSGRLLLAYHGHSDWVWWVAWSPDGRRVLSSSRDKTAQVWDASTARTLYTYTGHTASVNAALWSPDATRIASCSKDQTVHVWQSP